MKEAKLKKKMFRFLYCAPGHQNGSNEYEYRICFAVCPILVKIKFKISLV